MFPIVHTWLPNGYHSFHVHGIRNTWQYDFHSRDVSSYMGLRFWS
jgi:hypothetical protein